MKKIFDKLFAISFVICMILLESIVFADGAPDYNKNLYTVVVSNHNGGTLYYYGWSNEEHALTNYKSEIVPYGTIFVVEEETKIDGITYLVVSIDDYDVAERKYISSADVEIYGEPVTPADLRTKRRK